MSSDAAKPLECAEENADDVPNTAEEAEEGAAGDGVRKTLVDSGTPGPFENVGGPDGVPNAPL